MYRAAVLAAVFASFGRAQLPPPAAPVVLLREAGKPVAGATGEVWAEAAGVLTALRDLPRDGAFADALPRPQRLTGSSDAQGTLRLGAEGALLGTPASGWVRTAGGLGALLTLDPATTTRIDLQPLAAVTTATGSESLLVHARAWLPDGRTVVLLPPAAPTVQLPAGDYELWISSHEGWSWLRCRLQPGEARSVNLLGDAQRVRSGGAQLVPAGWPEVALRGDDTGILTLRGDARLATLLAVRGNEVVGPAALPASPGNEPLPWPPAPPASPATVRLQPVPAAAAGTLAVFSVLRTGNDTWRVLGASGVHDVAGRDGPERTFELPAPSGGDVWLVFAAADHAPQGQPWIGGPPRFPFALARGMPLTAVVRDERGLPVAGVEVDYAPRDMDAATVLGRSDGRGIVRLGRALAPGVLRVRDARFVNESRELAHVPLDAVALTAAPGCELRGVAKWPDGSPARGIVVTVRDPSGRLLPATRAVVTEPDGSFGFAGLPEQRGLVLFASAQRQGRTWSAKRDWVFAAGEPCELVVRDEDPHLGPAGGR
jgi:hypothetical protein